MTAHADKLAVSAGRHCDDEPEGYWHHPHPIVDRGTPSGEYTTAVVDRHAVHDDDLAPHWSLGVGTHEALVVGDVHSPGHVVLSGNMPEGMEGAHTPPRPIEHHPHPGLVEHAPHDDQREHGISGVWQLPCPYRQESNRPAEHCVMTGSLEPNASPAVHMPADMHQPHLESAVHVAQSGLPRHRLTGHEPGAVTHEYGVGVHVTTPEVASAAREQVPVASHHAQSLRSAQDVHPTRVLHSTGQTGREALAW